MCIIRTGMKLCGIVVIHKYFGVEIDGLPLFFLYRYSGLNYNG